MKLLKALVFSSMLISLGHADTTKNAEKMKEVSDYLQEVFKTYKPEEVLVVTDVDGTLTNHGTPDDQSAHSAVPRGNAAPMMQWLNTMKVKTVLSSAWDNFGGTTRRIKEIGLAGTHHLKEHSLVEKTPESRKLDLPTGSVDVRVFHDGQVASVQAVGHRDQTYDRQKALAPYLIWGKEEMAKIKKVIFLEDSSGNIQYFQQDKEKYKLYPAADVTYFMLGNPNQDPKMTAEESGLPGGVHSTASSGQPQGNGEACEAKTPSHVQVFDSGAIAAKIPESPGVHGVVTKEAALALLDTMKPGDVVYWPSSRYPGKFGFLRKKDSGDTTLDDALLLDQKGVDASIR